jgi:leucine-rich repeat protein SHOC2
LDKLGLDQFPTDLTSPTIYLSFLDLSNNFLTSIPAQVILNSLNSLTELYLDHNNLTVLPNELVYLGKLTVLSVNDNDLVELPDQIGKLEELQYLGVRGNKKLSTLPYSIADLPELTDLKFEKKEYLIPIQSMRALA